ncbi:protein THEM6-like isoform X1 [Oryzias latipes]|uniref:Protein THEM6 n=2 Tax=Oryzias latipes TaxID=8090 RepID=A0A3B3HZL6_ORYLA|nr:protein THEM6-like isoform X1 [Oryzias latipes]
MFNSCVGFILKALRKHRKTILSKSVPNFILKAIRKYRKRIRWRADSANLGRTEVCGGQVLNREMWWLLGVLAGLLVLFCSLDVWYFLRVAAVAVWAWFQPPVWDVTAEQVLKGRVTPHDIDMCHMNNARYLRECDFARIALYVRNGVFKALRALKASMVVGATTIRYRRALCIAEGYELRSRIVTWDDKAFFLEQQFVSSKDGFVCAVMYCKQSVIRSSPDKIMQHLCKRKVECPEFPEDLKHWVNFISASSQALRAESGHDDKNK